MAGGPMKDLYEFLVESELEQYYNSLHNDLKIQTVSQIKYLEEDDLVEQGMSKPEIRRLMKYFKKYHPQGAFGKIRKIINTTLNKELDSDSRPTSPLIERAKTQPGGSGTLGSSRHIIGSDAITLCKTLGKGEFGTVQQGVWTNDEGLKVQVAIKCLSKEKINQGVAEFLKEASNMHSLDHDHIVRLYGVVLEADALMLVTELAPLRSLLECLREPALRASFPVTSLTDFAYQIADGMAYLENKRLIHRDLAARNVLVFTKDKVKISDFGLSRALGVGKDYYQTNFNVNLKLPIAWCAPECINFLKFTSASDVWAYAVTLWEMFSYGFQPWAALTGEQKDLSDLSSAELVQLKQKILDAIDDPNYQRLDMPASCPAEYYRVMLKCWEHNPKERPTFAEILRILPQIKPEQVQAKVDSTHTNKAEFLHHRAHDIITVLDKKPENPPILGAWKGITDNGKTGLFDHKEVEPFYQIKTVNPRLRSIKVSRTDSSRKSMNQKKKIRADMISRPQNDLRHTGHIGYDGAVFGDVSFIGDNYDKLPVKVVSPYKPQDDLMTSSMTSSLDGHGKMYGGQSQLSLTTSMYSASSAGSGDTLTEVSSLDERTTNGKSSEYLDEDFTDFKIPDLGLSDSLGLDLDIGTSFMDEVMKKFESRDFSLEDTSFEGELSPDSKPKSALSPTGNGVHHSNDFDLGISNKVESKDRKQSDGWTPKSKMDEDQPSYKPQNVVAPTKHYQQEEEEEEDEETEEEETGSEEESESEDEENVTKDREREKSPQIKAMSLADERQMEEAIAKVNEFAQLREKFNHEDDGDAKGKEEGAAVHNKLFGFFKKSPQETELKKSFTEEIEEQRKNASEEDISAEGQEAYNILVVKGEQPKDKHHEDKNRDVDAREKRIRRALQQQQADAKRNANFREPQGIPIRRSSQEGLLDDPNPLRRLRESTVGRGRPLSDDVENKRSSTGSNSSIPSSRSNDSIRNPHLLPESGFLARFRDHDTDSSSVSNASNASDSPPMLKPKRLPPVPPPKPLRPGTINTKPRERRYQLDLSDSNDPARTSSEENVTHVIANTHAIANANLASVANTNASNANTANTAHANVVSNNVNTLTHTKGISHVVTNGDSQSSKDLMTMIQGPSTTDATASTKPSCCPLDVAKSSNSSHTNGEQLIQPTKSESTATKPTLPNLRNQHQFCVKLVNDSAQDLGLSDELDPFWKTEVNFSEFHPQEREGETTPTTFHYKTENASYEEMLDYAFDADEKNKKPRPRSTESQECDAIRLMKRVLSRDVTVEDCMIGLQETHWETQNAIKFIKLKQLLSLKVADKETCKQALVTCNWDCQDAASYIVANPKDQESPECVNI